MKNDSLMTALTSYIDKVVSEKLKNKSNRKINHELVLTKNLKLKDGITKPETESGFASLYIDSLDGDLKIKFGDGTIKTIVTDT